MTAFHAPDPSGVSGASRGARPKGRGRPAASSSGPSTGAAGTWAKAAGASVFHFCKVFHKATGLRFTDYVARMRLEDARDRLLNPNLRISEIAYDVGFQSLTQFNRTFKRVFGQSPTEFRARVSSGQHQHKTR